MKHLILIIAVILAGCGKSTETSTELIEANVQKTIQSKETSTELIEENVRITIQAKYDSDPATKGAVIDNVELKKSGDNKYTGSIEIISPDGSRMWPDLEVTVDGG